MSLGKISTSKNSFTFTFSFTSFICPVTEEGETNGHSLQCYQQIIKIFAQALDAGCHKALPVQYCFLDMEGWGFHMKQAR